MLYESIKHTRETSYTFELLIQNTSYCIPKCREHAMTYINSIQHWKHIQFSREESLKLCNKKTEELQSNQESGEKILQQITSLDKEKLAPHPPFLLLVLVPEIFTYCGRSMRMGLVVGSRKFYLQERNKAESSTNIIRGR